MKILSKEEELRLRKLVDHSQNIGARSIGQFFRIVGKFLNGSKFAVFAFTAIAFGIFFGSFYFKERIHNDKGIHKL